MPLEVLSAKYRLAGSICIDKDGSVKIEISDKFLFPK